MGEKSRARVLVVEDDASVRSLFRRALTDAGFRTECTADAAGALASLKEATFEAVIVDLDLGGLRGAELAREVMQQWPDTAVLVGTCGRDVATAVQWIQAGVYDYLIKPFDVVDIVVKLVRALERRDKMLGHRRWQEQLEAGARRNSRAASRLLIGAIESLSSALEAKDYYTRGHSERVSFLAAKVARAVGAPSDSVRRIRLAGRLHDIGKIGVSENILGKPSSLTEEERRHVQEHAVVGARILAPMLGDEEIVAMVRNHHEHYAGGGYPDGSAGSAIPLGARILAVADAFDALTSDRPYRARLTVEDALEVMRTGAGQQWQPTLVEALVEIREGESG